CLVIIRYVFIQGKHEMQSILTESLFNLGENLRGDLVTGVAFHTPQTTLMLIMIQEGLARLLEFMKSLRPCVDRVISSLYQGLSGEVIYARDFGRVEGRIVYSSRRFVYPARTNSS